MIDPEELRYRRKCGYFVAEIGQLQKYTDQIFFYLLLTEWLFAVICAAVVSPLAWKGAESQPHIHLISATWLGALTASLPCLLIKLLPGALITRLVVTCGQMFFSMLLIHLMGGRIEAHFHVFGSLAILAFYRDAWVFVPGVLLAASDHILRGLLWPESVFGAPTPSFWRAVEHALWVLFETFFLVWGIFQGRRHIWNMSELQASLSEERDLLEDRVNQRTEALAHARDYFANVLDSLDSHIAILDRKGEICSVNRAWRQFAEANQGLGELCGPGANYLLTCRNATEEDSGFGQRTAAAIEDLLAGRSQSYISEYSCHGPDVKRWFQVRISPFVGTDGAALVVAHVDITARVAAMEAFEEQSRVANSLAELIKETPNEVYLCDEDSLQFVMVNQGACQSLGYTAEELQAIGPSEIFSEADYHRLEMEVLSKPGPKDRLTLGQVHHRRKNGQVYPVQLSVFRTTFSGSPVLAIFATDVSDIHKLQDQLSQSQKMESIGQLAAGIAHEINTPMQCVAGNVEFIHSCHLRLFRVLEAFRQSLDNRDDSWGQLREQFRELAHETKLDHVMREAPVAVNEAADATQRVIEIVRAMKAMSHPGVKQLSPVDLNEIIRNSVTISRNRWKYVAEMTLNLDEQLPLVAGFSAELSQVLINLIVNSADAIAEKQAGASSPESAQLGAITIRTFATSDYVQFELSDTGSGIPEAIRERIFDPFFTTKAVGKGTGQGLAITYQSIVRLHQDPD